MARELYGFASGIGMETGLVRFGGMGLGNLLFSWARCAIFCKTINVPQIYTTWPQIKRRSWTHWEPDKRHYCFLFRPLTDEIHGLKKLQLLCSVPKIEESKWGAANDLPAIVVFRGLKNLFCDIPRSEYAWLKERFLFALRDRRLVNQNSEPHIGIHIRVGDKPEYNSKMGSPKNMQLPVSWYTHVIRRVSSELSWRGEIGVCSDATDEELRPVLRLPNVRLVRGRTAQEDLMYLAKSHLIVGSISTFSQWAAYLSGRPSIWHPEFDRSGGLGNGSLEMTMSEDRPPDQATWKSCMEKALVPLKQEVVTPVEN